VEDEKEEVPLIDDKKLKKEDYVIVDQKPNVLFGGKVLEYKLSDDLKKRLECASNVDEIRKTSEEILKWVIEQIAIDTERVKTLQVDIERLQDELYEREESLKELKARKNYYNNILETVGEPETKPIEEKKVDVKRNEIDFSSLSLLDFLKAIRF